MRKNILLTLMTLALVAPLGAQAPAPSAAPPAAPPAAQAATPSPNTWQLDSNHTTAGFSVRHMMVTNVHGTFGKVSGTINYDGKDVSTIAADVSIEATSINTNNEKRDTHLRSPDFFDTTNHPNITFKSKRVVKGSAPGTFKLVGDLTIRGVTKEVTLDVEGPTQPIIRGPGHQDRGDGDDLDQPPRLRRQVESGDRGGWRHGRRYGQDHDRHRGESPQRDGTFEPVGTPHDPIVPSREQQARVHRHTPLVGRQGGGLRHARVRPLCPSPRGTRSDCQRRQHGRVALAQPAPSQLGRLLLPDRVRGFDELATESSSSGRFRANPRACESRSGAASAARRRPGVRRSSFPTSEPSRDTSPATAPRARSSSSRSSQAIGSSACSIWIHPCSRGSTTRIDVGASGWRRFSSKRRISSGGSEGRAKSSTGARRRWRGQAQPY